MNIAIHIKTVGALLLMLAAAHVVFPKRFNWREELARLSLLNRQIFLVHCFFICLLLVLMGTLSVFYTDALLQPSPLARLVLFGLTLFWGLRLLTQLFVYDRALWRGNRFNTVAHFLFTGFWSYCTVAYGGALWLQFQV
jgi:hypothetical protein